MAAGGADVIGTHLEIGGVLFVCRHDSVVEVGRPAPSQHQVGQAKRNLSSQEVFINTCKKWHYFSPMKDFLADFAMRVLLFFFTFY